MSQVEKDFKRMYTDQVTRRKRETQLAHRWLLKMLAVCKSCAKNHQVGQFQLFNAAAPELKVGKQENILFL